METKIRNKNQMQRRLEIVAVGRTRVYRNIEHVVS